jgi:Ca2+-binding RTX toxin-like protein
LVHNVSEAQGVVNGNDQDNRITVRASNTVGVTVRGRFGDDTLIGGPGPDQLFGEGGDDTLIGNGGNDLLDGGEGIDSLSGGVGDDTLLNGENNNVPQFFIDAGESFRHLTVYGTLNADTINAVRTGVDDVRLTVNGVSRTFDMDDFDRIFMYGGPGNDTISAGNGIVAAGDGVDSKILFFGGRGNDRLNGNDQTSQLVGDAGDDTIFGNAGIDAIFGGDGNDTLDGGSGVDLINGEDGDDTITGGPGADGGNGGLIGGSGNDTFFVRDGEVDDVEGGGDPADRAQADLDDNLEGIEQILP